MKNDRTNAKGLFARKALALAVAGAVAGSLGAALLGSEKADAAGNCKMVIKELSNGSTARVVECSDGSLSDVLSKASEGLTSMKTASQDLAGAAKNPGTVAARSAALAAQQGESTNSALPAGAAPPTGAVGAAAGVASAVSKLSGSVKENQFGTDGSAILSKNSAFYEKLDAKGQAAYSAAIGSIGTDLSALQTQSSAKTAAVGAKGLKTGTESGTAAAEGTYKLDTTVENDYSKSWQSAEIKSIVYERDEKGNIKRDKYGHAIELKGADGKTQYESAAVTTAGTSSEADLQKMVENTDYAMKDMQKAMLTAVGNKDEKEWAYIQQKTGSMSRDVGGEYVSLGRAPTKEEVDDVAKQREIEIDMVKAARLAREAQWALDAEIVWKNRCIDQVNLGSETCSLGGKSDYINQQVQANARSFYDGKYGAGASYLMSADSYVDGMDAYEKALAQNKKAFGDDFTFATEQKGEASGSTAAKAVSIYSKESTMASKSKTALVSADSSADSSTVALLGQDETDRSKTIKCIDDYNYAGQLAVNQANADGAAAASLNGTFFTPGTWTNIVYSEPGAATAGCSVRYTDPLTPYANLMRSSNSQWQTGADASVGSLKAMTDARAARADLRGDKKEEAAFNINDPMAEVNGSSLSDSQKNEIQTLLNSAKTGLSKDAIAESRKTNSELLGGTVADRQGSVSSLSAKTLPNYVPKDGDTPEMIAAQQKRIDTANALSKYAASLSSGAANMSSSQLKSISDTSKANQTAYQTGGTDPTKTQAVVDGKGVDANAAGTVPSGLSSLIEGTDFKDFQ